MPSLQPGYDELASPALNCNDANENALLLAMTGTDYHEHCLVLLHMVLLFWPRVTGPVAVAVAVAIFAVAVALLVVPAVLAVVVVVVVAAF